MDDLYEIENALLKEQMRLDYGFDEGATPDSSPATLDKERSGPNPARQALECKYAGRFRERLDFGSLCTYVPNKKLPVFRWFKYKEGFSRALVERVLTDPRRPEPPRELRTYGIDGARLGTVATGALASPDWNRAR